MKAVVWGFGIYHEVILLGQRGKGWFLSEKKMVNDVKKVAEWTPMNWWGWLRMCLWISCDQREWY